MAKRIQGTTPMQDGFWMPAEYEEHERVWMCWPERTDNWRDGAKPAQEAYIEVAKAISRFEPVTMLVSSVQFANARNMLPSEVQVVEASYNDAWARDIGPSFLVNSEGELRACDWTFNAWGGLVDGLYFPWDKDDALAQKICELVGADSYRTEGFVLEGGSFHVDGAGTILTTEMCLLSEGRNSHMNKWEIEKKLKEYLNANKVIWLKMGIDPEETNGHIDDVACFIAPGEVVCIYEENRASPFYLPSHQAYEQLLKETDAQGNPLTVHQLCCPKQAVYIEAGARIDRTGNAMIRTENTRCIASYANFLIVNGGVIVPQYGDENDTLAIAQLEELFPNRKVVGVYTKEIVYGGGNIHCITQQQPKTRMNI